MNFFFNVATNSYPAGITKESIILFIWLKSLTICCASWYLPRDPTLDKRAILSRWSLIICFQDAIVSFFLFYFQGLFNWLQTKYGIGVSQQYMQTLYLPTESGLTSTVSLKCKNSIQIWKSWCNKHGINQRHSKHSIDFKSLSHSDIYTIFWKLFLTI